MEQGGRGWVHAGQRGNCATTCVRIILTVGRRNVPDGHCAVRTLRNFIGKFPLLTEGERCTDVMLTERLRAPRLKSGTLAEVTQRELRVMSTTPPPGPPPPGSPWGPPPGGFGTRIEEAMELIQMEL